jgi:hypothetical protein
MSTMDTATYYDPLTIETTYCGPPTSAHGGVAVGRFAQLVGAGPAEVRLLGPPPLAVPLHARTEDDGTVWVSGPEGELARVRALAEPLEIAAFRRVGDEELEAAADEFLALVAEKGHAFPTCFACGTDRHDPDALHQFTGKASDGDTVAPFHVAGEGPLPDWLTLAGLDCPSGHTAFSLAEQPPAVAVLGSMRCQSYAPANAGVQYQVRGRLHSVKGRKLISEVAILAPDGSTVAAAQATWIAVDGAAFGAASAEKTDR